MNSALQQDLRLFVIRHEHGETEEAITIRLPKNAQQVHMGRDQDGRWTGNVMLTVEQSAPYWPPLQVG